MRDDRSFESAARDAEARLRAEELADAAGLSLSGLARLVAIGAIEPLDPHRREFGAAAAPRLRRMLRLWEDLGVNFAGAAIILDLLDRLDRLELEIERLRRER